MAREQRLVFGEVAEDYDRVRPGYPEAVFDTILADVDPDAPILEIGCGTGRATVPLARRGRTVLALEPSPDMAAVAARNLAPYPQVRIQRTGFEDWPVDGTRFGGLVAAQAWHWVSPAARVAKAHDVLRPGGVVALCWNRPHWSADDPVRGGLDATYERLAPELHARRPGFPGLRDGTAGAPTSVTELDESPGFGPVTRRDYPWREVYDAERYVALLATQSDHRMLAEDQRRRLLDAVAAVVDAAGGVVTVDYVAELYRTRREP